MNEKQREWAERALDQLSRSLALAASACANLARIVAELDLGPDGGPPVPVPPIEKLNRIGLEAGEDPTL